MRTAQMTPKVKAMLGNAREFMVKVAANKILSGVSWEKYNPDFDWKNTMTVWELRLGEILAEDQGPEEAGEPVPAPVEPPSDDAAAEAEKEPPIPAS